MIQFWQNVKDELNFQNLTQKELANSISESYNTLQTWIKNDRYPDANQSVKIAKVLKTSVEYLVTGKSEITSTDGSRSVELLEQLLLKLREDNAKSMEIINNAIRKMKPKG